MMGIDESGGVAGGRGFAARAARGDGGATTRRPAEAGRSRPSSEARAAAGEASPVAGGRVSASAAPARRQSAQRMRTLAVVAAASAAVAVASVGYGAWASASARAATDVLVAEMEATVVASSAIRAGEAIAEESLAVVDVPRAFRSEGALGAGDAVIGGKATVDIPAGSQIVAGLVAGVGQGGHLAAALEPGREAVTVAVDAETGIAGQIRPFDVVRVVSAEAAGSGEALLRTVCERALVVSVGDGRDDSAVSPGSVTLSVSPEEADAVREAQYAGGVSFALVSLADAMEEGYRGQGA